MCPNEEEEKLLNENKHIADELSKEEQFLLKLMKVPHLEQHLQCIEIKQQFNPRFLSLNKSLQKLRIAVVGIEENPELKQVLVMLLKIGNYLNQGTKKGGLASFTIEFLQQTTMAKGVGKH